MNIKNHGKSLSYKLQIFKPAMKKSEKPKASKIILLTLSFCSLIVLVTGVYPSMLPNYYTISSRGVIVTSGSYIVYRNRAEVFALNNITGEVEFSSADASTVIQYTVDSVTAHGGGNILIRDGEYDLSDEIVFGKGYSHITLEGESWNTVLKTNNGAYNAIRFKGTSTAPNVGCVIRNLKIDGGVGVEEPEWPQWDEKNGIMTTCTVNSTFENLFVTNTGRTGIYNTQFSQGNIIRYNYLYRCHRYGISYTSSNRGIVINNTVEECSSGIVWDSTYGNNWYTIFANNTFIRNSYSDMFVEGTPTSPSKYGIIKDNTFYSNGSKAIRLNYAFDTIAAGNKIHRVGYGPSGSEFIYIAFSENITISNNLCDGTAYEQVAVWHSRNIMIVNNDFYSQSNGIILHANTNYTHIKNNEFVGQNCIWISSNNNNDNVIAGNNFTGPTGTKISDNGVGTQIYNNTGYTGTQLSYYISISPASAFIEKGLTQTFTVTVVGGTEPYTYQWRIDEVLQAETSDTLTVTPFSTTHVISIQVTDNNGNITADMVILYVQWTTRKP
ncbi:MAG: right-handed parallel beta-helix repeat-containing protein [Candidatus Heimdallarchaeaceae archaeon]